MPRTCLIGHTGFVGSNLAKQHVFEDCYNSRNIEDIRGRVYDRLVCCGVSAVKWQANRFPAEDRAAIDRLLKNLAYVRSEQVVLISTVDVYPSPDGVDESFDPHGHANHAYGTNRLYAEDAIRKLFDRTQVVRLPAVFGPGLKKNFIYDLMHDNHLEAIHPNSKFQYYDIRRLWNDLQLVLQDDLKLINFATEPLETREIVDRYFPGKQIGSQAGRFAPYDMRTRYAALFGGSRGYIYTAEQVLAHLGDWIDQDKRGVAA
jgi:nucleoside-diphosphate-sugar epimerase